MADAKSDTLENQILRMIFNATSIAGLCDPDATSPLTALSVQLHTGSPTDTGDLTSLETTYGGYARVGVERTSSGWTVTGSTVQPTATITFPQCTAGTATITHFSVGNSTTAGSTGIVYYYGTVTPNISVAAGVTPSLTTATAISEL